MKGMNIKGMIIIFLVLSIVPLSCGNKYIHKKYPDSDQGALKCFPRVFSSNSEITLKLPERPPRNLGIEDPAGNFYYVMGDGGFVKYNEFITGREIKLKVDDVKGILWVDGKKEIRNVFEKPGEYTLYMADNMETEPENTFSIETKVFYRKK